MIPATRRATPFLIFLAALLLAASPGGAIEIQEVKTESGITAWLVEDYTVPIISTSFDFAGGGNQDPEGKAGLTAMLAAMMDEGAGDRDTAALKGELEARGIELGFLASRDSLSGGMRILASERQPAFDLLRLILTAPRFEAASLARIRASMIAGRKREQTNPRAVLGKRMRETLFPDHPYGRPLRGTAESLAAISQEDIIAQHRRLFARDNLYIGVVGAIDAAALAALIDATFGGLPEKADLAPVADVKPQFGVTSHIDFDTPQTIVSMALPAVKRDHPDFFAAYLLNHILGGGTFSSRLYQEIREERGLVYRVGTSMTLRDHTAYIAGGFSTRPDQAAAALAIMRAEIARLATDGPSAAELEAARTYVLGAYAIDNLDTSTKIADVLVGLQLEGLGRDYIENRQTEINAVTLDDVRRVARTLLGVAPTIATIGPADV